MDVPASESGMGANTQTLPIGRRLQDDQDALDGLILAFNKLHAETGLLSDEYPCF